MSLRALQVGEGWFPHAPGGLTRYYHDLMRHLPAHGVDASGMVVGTSAVARETRGRVRAFAPADSPLLARWGAARQAARQRLRHEDMLVCHFALYGFPLLDLIGRKPLVTHFHGPWSAESGVEDAKAHPVKFAVEWAVYQRSRRLVVLSHAFADLLAERYRVPPHRIRVVPGGIEAARFAPRMGRDAARRRLGWPTDRPIVLTVRRLTRRMGLEHLVDAAAIARREVPDLLVLIAGEGPLAAPLARRVAEAGLGDHVRLIGRLPDPMLPLAYRAADLGVVPTTALEGFGLVVAEALAAGLPSLVTPVGGLPEVVRGLSEGLVLDAATPAAIADGLVGALTGRRPLPDAEACIVHARTRFDWSTVTRRLAATYREALAE